MKKKIHQQSSPKEEFSIEFGDVNGIKLYELFASNRQDKEEGSTTKSSSNKKK
ncbi:hypothetical protein [Bacillus sp. FJAT-27445]|uniref:hypothetical protein n=1 Tax=Bacillus sp. FJAT-27445 TaxID=1679166 RepID=UPI000A6504FC|nr:hypothetical protein [Bacillus sp. FJAT-27445]